MIYLKEIRLNEVVIIVFTVHKFVSRFGYSYQSGDSAWRVV